MSSKLRSNSESAQKIKELRDALDFTQEELAARLGMKRVAVTIWESGRSQPATVAYMRLAVLANEAGYPDAAWFWQKAGINNAVIRELLPEFDKSLKASERRVKNAISAPSGDTVRIPLLRNLRGRREDVIRLMQTPALVPAEQVEKWLTLPIELVPNPASTACFRSPDEHMRPIFGRDNIVIVDTSGTLEEYWGDGAIVAAYRFSTSESGQICFRWLRASMNGGLTLRLISEAGPRISAQAGVLAAADTALSRLLDREAWTSSFKEASENLKELRRVEAELGGSEGIAVSDNPEWSILGRVICWIGTDQGSREMTNGKAPQGNAK